MNGGTAIAVVGPHGAVVAHAIVGECSEEVAGLTSHRSRLLNLAAEAMELYEEKVPAGRKSGSIVHIFPAETNQKVPLCCEVYDLSRMILNGGYNVQIHEYMHPSQKQWIHISATKESAAEICKVQPIVSLNGFHFAHREYELKNGQFDPQPTQSA